MASLNRRTFVHTFCAGATMVGLNPKICFAGSTGHEQTPSLYLMNKDLLLNTENHWGVERAAFLKSLLNKQTKDLFPIKDLAQKTHRQKIEQINKTVNQNHYASDQTLFGHEDVWVTPEIFAEKGGDCEDFALTKFSYLSNIDVPASQMFIVGVRHKKSRVAHASLALLNGHDGFLILDNAKDTLYSDRSYGEFYDLLYALSVDGLWQPIT